MKKYDVAIIGCGPAGMCAAIYLARCGISCCILEGSVPGGQMIDNGMIENYPGFKSISGSELALLIMGQLKELSVPILYQKVLDIALLDNKKIVSTAKEKIEVDYVIIATGRKPKKLGVTNEDILSGKGISYCAICDGTLYKNKDVLVIGGSDSAFEAVSYLSRFVSHVTLIHRRDEYRAKKMLIDKVKALENVSFVVGEVEEFVSEKDLLSGVILKDGKNIPANGAFVYIGQLPNTDIFKNLGILDELSYIKVDEDYQTSIDGIYAIGDCILKEEFQIVIAMGEAAKVALGIARR